MGKHRARPGEAEVTSEPTQAPSFEPWERFMLLSHAIEEVPLERAGELLAPVTSTAMTVVRQLMGQKTRLEAFMAIERTRELVEAARKGTPAQPDGPGLASAEAP